MSVMAPFSKKDYGHTQSDNVILVVVVVGCKNRPFMKNLRSRKVLFYLLIPLLAALPFAVLAAGHVFIDLGTLGNSELHAFDLNENSQLTGRASLEDETGQIFLFDTGGMQDLATLAGSSSVGMGININGQLPGPGSIKAGRLL